MKKKKSKSTGKGSLSKMAHKYAEKPTKGNFKNTGIKSGAEILTLVGGGALSAGLGGFGNGYVSIGVGLAAIVAGNYFGDPTKLSSVLGASMVGYGIGKINEHKALSSNQELQGLSGAKSKLGEGFSRFAGELLTVVGMKKKEGSNTEQAPDESVGSIDVSILDQFEDLNRVEAIRFDEEQRERQEFETELQEELLDAAEVEQEVEGVDEEAFSFAEFEDVDIATL